MSVLQGLAPIVQVTNNVGSVLSNLSDNDCVRMLLSSYSDDEKKANESYSDKLDNKFNLMTSSNKSLLVTSSHNDDAKSCQDPADNYKFVCDESYVVYKEKFRYKLESPDNGVLQVNDLVESENPSGMTLNEIKNNVTQEMLNSQDSFRKNSYNKISNTLGPDALGVVDKFGKLNSDGSISIKNFDTKTNSDFSFNFYKTVSDPSLYKYGTIKVSNDTNHTINVVNTGGNAIIGIDGNEIKSESFTLQDYEGKDYTGGNYGIDKYNNLTSGKVEISYTSTETAAFTQQFSDIYNDPNRSKVTLDSTVVNVSELGNNYPKGKLVARQILNDYNNKIQDSNGNDVDFLSRERTVLNGFYQNEYIQDPNWLNKSSTIKIDNRNPNNRMSGIVNNVISETNVFYDNNELPTPNLNNFDVLSFDEHTTDINYNINLLQSSTVENDIAQYKVLDDNVSVTLINNDLPVRNLVFSINEVKNVEIVNDVENNDGFLLNLEDPSKNLDLDEKQVPDDGGSQVLHNSFVSVSFLRNKGIASSNINNLRVLFQKRMPDSILKASRDSNLSYNELDLSTSGMVSGDNFTRIMTSNTNINSSRSVFEMIDNSKTVEWDPDLQVNELLQLQNLNSNAKQYRFNYFTRFIQGGDVLRKEASRGPISSDGKRVYLPYKVQAEFLQWNGELLDGNKIWSKSSPDQTISDIDNAKIELLSSSLSEADDLGNKIRTVNAKITHNTLIPTLTNRQIVTTLTYKYFEEGPNAWKWTNYSVSNPRGITPICSTILDLNPAFVFPHQAKLQGQSENKWEDFEHSQININLSLSYSSSDYSVNNKYLEFTDGSNYNISLKLYSNYNTTDENGNVDVPSFYNNNYSLPLKLKPGNWISKYAELTDNNMENLNKNSISNLLLTSTNTFNVVAERATFNTTQTTLTIKNGEKSLFKCSVDNNLLGDLVGYSMSDSWIEAIRVEGNKSLFKSLVRDNSTQKLENGVFVKFSKLSSVRTQRVVSLSVKNDLYQIDFPNVSLRDVPNSLVLYDGGYDNAYINLFNKILCTKRRGMKNGDYIMKRVSGKLFVQWLDDKDPSKNLEEYVVINTSPTISGGRKRVTANFGKNCGISFSVSRNAVMPESLDEYDDSYKFNLYLKHMMGTFTQNYSNVKLSRYIKNMKFYEGNLIRAYDGSYALVESFDHNMKTLSDSMTLTESLPWIERYKLNNFFYPNQTLSIYFDQSPIKVEYLQNYTFNDENHLKSSFNNSSLLFTIDDSQLYLYPNKASISGNELFLNYVPKLRRKSNEIYTCIIPEVLKLELTDKDPQYHVVLNRNNLNLQLAGSNFNTHYLSLKDLDSSKLASYNHTFNVEKKHLKLTLQGSLNMNDVYDDNLSEIWNSTWHTYLDKVDFVKTKMVKWSSSDSFPIDVFAPDAFGQQSANLDDRDSLKFMWDLNNATRFIGDAWSEEIIVSPKILSKVVQYVLRFKLNNGELKPQVSKLTSALFNPNKLLDNSKVGNISLIKINMATQEETELNVDIKDIGLPYEFTNSSVYPKDQNKYDDNGLLLESFEPSANFSNSNLAINSLDLLIQVDNTDKSSRSKYTSLFGATKSGVNKVVSVFSKDQLVLVNHLGKLSMRVGPDGRLYTGDVSSYSYYCNSINTLLDGLQAANGIMTLPLNNNVALNNMVQQ